MAETTGNSDHEQMLLVIDGKDGERYAIPSDVLEHFRLPEGVTGADQPDVEGFGWGWNFSWTQPNRLVGPQGYNFISEQGGAFRNTRYWG